MEFEVLFKGASDQSRFLTSEPAIPHSLSSIKFAIDVTQNSNGAPPADIDPAVSVEEEAEKLLTQYCSIPLRRHPRQAALEAQSRSWLADLHCPYLPYTLVQRLLDTRLDTLGCVFFPQSSDDKRSMALIKLMHWFFILDDIVDDPHLLGHNYDAARRFVLRQFRAMFNDNIKEAQVMGLIDADGYGFENGASGLAALREREAALAVSKEGVQTLQQAWVRQELVIEMGVQWASEMQANGLSARQVERLREAVAQYLLGVILVVRLRQEKRLPSVDEYIYLRRMDGAEKLVMLACEFDVHIELDEEKLHHPLIQRLQTATVNQALWTNDLLSFYRECHNDDYVSLLAVLHYNNVAGNAVKATGDQNPSTEMADFKEALDQARAMIKACDDECMRLTQEIAAWRPNLCHYVDSTLFAVSGMGFWTLWSSRYHTRGVLI